MTVTVISGFLGSGKTTLLRRFLREQRDLRVAVIVNDMSGLEVDGDLVRAGHRVSEAKGTLVSLFAGSISGDKRPAFGQALDGLRTRADLDHLFVETSGGAHPGALIQEIESRPFLTLDTFITLIDAAAFVADFDAGRRLIGTIASNADAATRSVENLMAEQIQCASLILLTKVDRVKKENLPVVLESVRMLNPHAGIHPCEYGRVSPELLFNTKGFSRSQARNASLAWQGHDAGEAACYDLGADVLRDPRPFHPLRLWRLFRERLGAGIHRSKGFIWMASRPEQVLLWNQAGGSLELELTAYWKAAVLKDPRGNLLEEEKQFLKNMLAHTHPLFGDRMNEMTVIGAARDRQVFMQELWGCLCTENEIEQWRTDQHFPDPWPTALKKLA